MKNKASPVISIVLPAYNAEKCINKMIDSILAQTFQNWELIVVDDGSTDSTKKICDSYAKRDGRIFVRSERNSGPSSARNLGMSIVNGKYLTFADADDVCEENWLKKMLNAITKYNCEMVMCNWVEIKQESAEKPKTFPYNRLVITNEELVDYMHGLAGSVWNKLFVMDIIRKNHIAFDITRKRGEDFLFVIDYLLQIDNVALVSEPLYQYINQPDTLSHIKDVGLLEMEILEAQRVSIAHASASGRKNVENRLRHYVINSHFNALIILNTKYMIKTYNSIIIKELDLYAGDMDKKQRLYLNMVHILPALFCHAWQCGYYLKNARK